MVTRHAPAVKAFGVAARALHANRQASHGASSAERLGLARGSVENSERFAIENEPDAREGAKGGDDIVRARAR